MNREIIPYGKQYIDDDDIEKVVEVLKGDYVTTGPYVKQFEDDFANYVGAKYAVAVSSGTAALHLACIALELGTGDEVITTPMTFAASANCAVYVGAKPVFADIDETTYNIDPAEIEKRITSDTKVIIPVHYTGLPCDMEQIHKIAKKYNLNVIEDACHALGAKHKDTKIGDCKYSDIAVFSFHPVKHITTGEGGMLTTNSEEIYDKLLMLRNHGITRDTANMTASHGGWYYEMQMLGYNYRITDIQCALGSSQLKKIDKFVNKRREIVARYNDAFKDLPIILPKEPEGYYNSHHLYVIKIDDKSSITRKQLYDYLRDKGIYCQVHYIPVHLQPYYKENFNYKAGDFPVAEKHYDKALSLPLYPAMSEDEVDYVVKSLADLFNGEEKRT